MSSEELEMMQGPDKWPQWPFLPLKRYIGSGLETAFLFNEGLVGKTKEPVVLYIGNIFAPNEAVGKKFSTLQDILDEGWVVD